jgi:excisionase family DNA binding protein
MSVKPPPKNVAEAAEYLGISESKLAKLRCFGGGPEFLKLGSRVLYEEADLEKWKQARKRRSTSDVMEVA